MHKFLPTLLLLVLVGVAYGQISLTSAYFPSGGDTLFFTTTPNESTVDLLAPGGPRNWDFSQLNAGPNVRQAVTALVPNTPGAPFPQANLKIQVGPISTNYYVRTDTQLRLVGNEGGTELLPDFTVTTPFSPAYIERRAPLNFLSQFQSTSAILVPLAVDSLPQAILDLGGVLLAGFDSIRLRTNINTLDLVDAYGNLTVGGSTYPVLREKRTEIRDIRLEAKLGFLPWTDVTNLIAAGIPALAGLVGQDTLVTYSFWNNESIEPIALVETEPDGTTVTNIRYKNDRLSSSVEEAFLSNADVKLFPNPARHAAVFTAEGLLRGQYILQVQDLTGRPIQRRFFDSTGTLRHELDVSQWPAGLYFCSLTNARGRILATQRLLVGGY